MFFNPCSCQLPNACELSEDCARCVKRLQGNDVDCDELEASPDCNATLYTEDVEPGESVRKVTIISMLFC